MEEKKLTIANQIMILLTDNGKMSPKEIMREMREQGVKLNNEGGSIYTALMAMRKYGYIRHAGYQRYELTDEAKPHITRILSGDNPNMRDIKNHREIESTTPQGGGLTDSKRIKARAGRHLICKC